MANEIKLVKAHAEQTKIYRSRGSRNVIRCGRRFGKTTMFENWASNWSMHQKRVGWFSPSYKLLLPSYNRILKMVRPAVKSSSKIDGIIELVTGGAIEFWTLNDPDAGRSRFYDEVLIDEASLVKGLRDIWELSIAPTLLDRGGNASMAGTPKGIDIENYFYLACTDKSLLDGWKEFHAPTSANPMLDPLAVAALAGKYPPLVFQQEYKAEFVDWNGSAFFGELTMLVDGQPVEMPEKCDQVFAVIDTALKDGFEHDGTAVTYYARSKYSGHPLIVLDWEILQIQGAMLEDWLPSVNMRLEQLSAQTKARQGNVGIYIEDKASGIVLIQQGIRRGLPVYPVPAAMTALGKEGRALSVSGYVFQGLVKICRYAYEKTINYKGQTRNHFISQVCSFRMGQKDGPRDLLDTFCYGVAISLGDSEGY